MYTHIGHGGPAERPHPQKSDLINLKSAKRLVPSGIRRCT